MTDFELLRIDTLRLGYGVAQMAQPFLADRQIFKSLQYASGLIRRARTVSEFEKAAHYFRQLYKDIVDLESYIRDRKVEGVSYARKRDRGEDELIDG